MNCLVPLGRWAQVRLAMGQEQAQVLQEIESLRGQLMGLESAVMEGQAQPAAVKVRPLATSVGGLGGQGQGQETGRGGVKTNWTSRQECDCAGGQL